MDSFNDREWPFAFAQPDAGARFVEPLKKVDQMHAVRGLPRTFRNAIALSSESRLASEAREQSERVVALNLLQLLLAEDAALVQPLHVIGHGARRVIGAEDNL